MDVWFEKWPDRLAHELEQLAAANIRFKKDERAARAGILRLDLWPIFNGQETHLVATFPDSYPFFRFEVEARDENLPYHQNPQSKALCFLPRESGAWRTTDTLAAFIQNRLPTLVKTAKQTDLQVIGAEEQHQAEPFEEYYPMSVGISILVDSSWKIDPTIDSGALRIGYAVPDHWKVPQAAVLEVCDTYGTPITQCEPELHRLYSHHIVKCRWIRAREPIALFDPTAFFNKVQKLDPRPQGNRQHLYENTKLQIWGVLFPEETNSWRVKGEGWIFIARVQRVRVPLYP